MKRIRIVSLVLVIVLALSFVTGCQENTQPPVESEFTKIERDMETLKARALANMGRKNIRIILDFFYTDQSEYSKVDMLWDYADENAMIKTNREEFSRSGFRMGLATEDMLAKLILLGKQVESAGRTRQFITVGNRITGHMAIGTGITVPRFYYAGKNYSSVDYDFVRAGLFLTVEARKLNDEEIEVELTPVISKLSDDKYTGRIEMTELHTKVIAKNGQGIVIGSVDSQENSIANIFLGKEEGGVKKKAILVLTPYFLKEKDIAK